MTILKGYTQGAICTFATGWATKVYPVEEDVTDTDGLTVRCCLWLPVGKSYAPQSDSIDVAFQRRRRVYLPAADAQEGTPRPVALELDCESGVLALLAVDSFTAQNDSTGVIP